MLAQKKRRLQIETKRLDSVIYDDLRTRIVSLHYAPGEMISGKRDFGRIWCQPHPGEPRIRSTGA